MSDIITIDDYRHYFEECFGIYEDTAVYVQKIEPGPTRGVFRINGLKVVNGMWYPFNGFSTKMLYPNPNLGYVNVYDAAVYVKRLPLRQWKKGLHKQILRITFPPAELMNCVAEFEHELRGLTNSSSVLVESLLYPKYPAYNDVLQAISNGTLLCRAVSSEVMLSATTTDKIGVYYAEMLIGFFSNGILFINKSSTMLVQHLKEVFPTTQVRIWEPETNTNKM